MEGFYMKIGQLKLFVDHEFYIPEKLFWFMNPHMEVNWLGYKAVVNEIRLSLSQKRSPMIWLKSAKEELFKCFVVWW